MVVDPSCFYALYRSSFNARRKRMSNVSMVIVPCVIAYQTIHARYLFCQSKRDILTFPNINGRRASVCMHMS